MASVNYNDMIVARSRWYQFMQENDLKMDSDFYTFLDSPNPIHYNAQGQCLNDLAESVVTKVGMLTGPHWRTMLKAYFAKQS